MIFNSPSFPDFVSGFNNILFKTGILHLNSTQSLIVKTIKYNFQYIGSAVLLCYWTAALKNMNFCGHFE